MPNGLLGTRADLLVEVILACNLLAPLWAGYAARLARKGQHQAHMRLQLVLIALLFTCLFVLETHIRFSGGSGSLVAGSPYTGTTLLKVTFLLHIVPAMLTYVAWAVLVFKSYRRRKTPSLGTFSARHKAWGKIVIVGLVWVAVSAIAVFYLGFAALGDTALPAAGRL